MAYCDKRICEKNDLGLKCEVRESTPDEEMWNVKNYEFNMFPTFTATKAGKDNLLAGIAFNYIVFSAMEAGSKDVDVWRKTAVENVAKAEAHLELAFKELCDAQCNARALAIAEKLYALRYQPNDSECAWMQRPLNTRNDEVRNEEISNAVYHMCIWLRKITWMTKTDVVWEVRYTVSMKDLCEKSACFKSQEKSFASEDDAVKYYEGRKTAMKKAYFSETNPKIPKDMEYHFSFMGYKVPGYRYESDDE